jgi:hypothetical protein
MLHHIWDDSRKILRDLIALLFVLLKKKKLGFFLSFLLTFKKILTIMFYSTLKKHCGNLKFFFFLVNWQSKV